MGAASFTVSTSFFGVCFATTFVYGSIGWAGVIIFVTNGFFNSIFGATLFTTGSAGFYWSSFFFSGAGPLLWETVSFYKSLNLYYLLIIFDLINLLISNTYFIDYKIGTVVGAGVVTGTGTVAGDDGSVWTGYD